jgi:hypothetical protein
MASLLKVARAAGVLKVAAPVMQVGGFSQRGSSRIPGAFRI